MFPQDDSFKSRVFSQDPYNLTIEMMCDFRLTIAASERETCVHNSCFFQTATLNVKDRSIWGEGIRDLSIGNNYLENLGKYLDLFFFQVILKGLYHW